MKIALWSLNGCDETSSNGSTVNTQTSNSDGTSDGMVNLQPSTNDHASGDGSTPNPQPSSSHHSSENDSTALPGCSNTNSVTFSTTLSLGSASVTSTSTITGQGIAYSETFCSIKGPTTTLETTLYLAEGTMNGCSLSSGMLGHIYSSEEPNEAKLSVF